ncbi:molybdenum cofactor biosynthesis protein [Bacillus lacus]|uniref:Molybdenum cofactor biosynthesis protein B n=1 Tax=Metabacillus lacus TaxID=1983721 RepID=A0A7X2IXN9_9BACI|nr:MogA/MoaB family molybdenum cofactor biosynthesis protein [Metabacillus lacus]MRX71732.1 molybdenum cofactor biosynthesis protein [Metabacillus lacus]
MSIVQHRDQAPASVAIKVITVSDTRKKEDDRSGELIVSLLKEAGHQLIGHIIVKDEKSLIRSALLDGCENKNIDAVITNGGTGLAKRDVSIEALKMIVEKEIPGFGELFRMLSYQEGLKSGAMMSRAAAGISMDTVVIALPGSTGAVKLAMEKLILPEIGHLVFEAKKDL